MSETIFALSSGAPPSGIAIVRLSGPAAAAAVMALTGMPAPAPRRAVLRTLRDADGAAIDTGLVLFWRGPASFTGEDVAELHVHGSRAVVARLMAVLARQPGCRPALAGEFTRQAFLNGRMDLTAVEGLGDLIAAATEAQRRAALAQLEGGLRQRCEALARRLTDAQALLEAAIDFSDESDVPAEIVVEARIEIVAVRDGVAGLLAAGRPAERIRDGLTVVLAGAPNAGKSSLMNALAGRDVAIVSAEAGTTRDILTVDLDLGGYPLRLIDTAGLREAGGAVEREGVRRARARAAAADLVLLLRPADAADAVPALATAAPVWDLRSKADLAGDVPVPAGVIPVSTVAAGGLDALLARLAAFAAETFVAGDGDILLQERQRGLLISCRDHLDIALDRDDALDLMAEETRAALTTLGGITGAVSADAVLGAIFARFCIGK